MGTDSTTDHQDRLTSDALQWLVRNYETQEAWKNEAIAIYFGANGDSVLARTKLSARLRKYFLEEGPKTEDVDLWDANFSGSKQVSVSPPKVNASNASYIDWLYIADYLLLGCGSPREDIEDENQKRETEYQQLLSSYQFRLHVHVALQEMEGSSDLDDKAILARIKKDLPKASLANVKEARKFQKESKDYRAPTEPERPEALPLYKSLFFKLP